MHGTVVFTSRRAQRAQQIQGGRHALVGVTLALSGIEAFRASHGTWADGVGVIGGGILLFAFLREVRTARTGGHGGHHGIGWVDVFAAVVTAVEAWHLHHQGKHGLPIAYGLVAAILLGLGLAHPRLARLRRLIVSPEGFDVRMSPWRRVRAAWADVAAVEADGAAVSVAMHDGRSHRFDFTDADHREVVVEAFVRAASEALPATAPASPAEATLPPGTEPALAPGDTARDAR